ncbi:uncharacterized protein [Typha latifolia]|uniref:uncharacterized protein n=1 Tax=Typha latifolia TaxID=4733 RepID=UPI003C2ABD02
MSGLLCKATTCSNLRSCHSVPSPLLCLITTNKSLLVFRKSLLPLPRLRSPTPISISPLPARFVPRAAAASMEATEKPKPFSVLFVCLGNICRSPAAEAVFRDLVRRRNLESSFKIDSAGTIGYHEGDPADSRMRAASKRRGIEVTSVSRPIKPSDFREFDLILAMDMQNKDDILSAFERWRFKEPLPDDAPKKVKLICSYCKKHKVTEVPDPYYGGQQGFENVLDLLEDACGELLDSILVENCNNSV